MLGKWFAGVALALCGAGSVSADYCETPPAAVLDSVVRITGENTEGSGVVIAPDRVITAAHVVTAMRVPMVDINGIPRPATVTAINEAKDFALLEVSTGGLEVVPLRSTPMDEYETVWAVGFPLGGDQVINEGEFEGVIEDGTLHTTASVDHGQSGGGLISCENGRHVLAGMTTGFGAINAGGEIIRLDDYSVALSAMDIRPMVEGSIHQTVAWVDTRETTEISEPYYEEYIPEAASAGYEEDNYEALLPLIGRPDYYPYLYYEERP